MKQLIPQEIIEKRIFLIRGQKVMLDFHLADLYEVETKALKRAVKRNLERFPDDFCITLTSFEWKNLRCHFGTSSSVQWGGTRYLPYAFTEQGVAMLSTVLRSKKAVLVNIEIMRTFVRLREILATHKDLTYKLEELERKFETHDKQIISIFEAIRQLILLPEKPKRQIGFQVKEQKIKYRVK